MNATKFSLSDMGRQWRPNNTARASPSPNRLSESVPAAAECFRHSAALERHGTTSDAVWERTAAQPTLLTYDEHWRLVYGD